MVGVYVNSHVLKLQNSSIFHFLKYAITILFPNFKKFAQKLFVSSESRVCSHFLVIKNNS